MIGRGIGFFGGGHMGRSLIAALCRAGAPPHRIHLFDPLPLVRESLARELGIEVTDDPSTFLYRIDVLVLAVKPQEMAAAVAPWREALALARPLVISVAAGLTIARLQELCGAGLDIVRAMPNRAATVGESASGLFVPPALIHAAERAEAILGTAGAVVRVQDEAMLDLVTGISGSGPAYFFLLAEALAAAGRAGGLDADTANLLATATLRGAGALTERGADLAALRASVTSKGGTTAAALEVLRESGLESIVNHAVRAATLRSREMSAGEPPCNK
jgi:pyrroline-5-carboxylate reductase